jgi:hypothetical protein
MIYLSSAYVILIPSQTKRHRYNFSWIKILITPNSIHPKKGSRKVGKINRGRLWVGV